MFTWSGVSCCQIYLTCWWFLAHWTWHHVFLTCYMLVAFGTSDMISCYWHVYHLWSGHDVLYLFRFLSLPTPFITHSILVKTYFMVSFLSRQPHMLVDSGTFDMSADFPRLVFCYPTTLIHLPHCYYPNMFKCIMLSALPHMLVTLGTPKMTSCFLLIQISSTVIYPFITHSVISNICSLVSLMFVLPDIGWIPPDTVSTFNSHSIQLNGHVLSAPCPPPTYCPPHVRRRFTVSPMSAADLRLLQGLISQSSMNLKSIWR